MGFIESRDCPGHPVVKVRIEEWHHCHFIYNDLRRFTGKLFPNLPVRGLTDLGRQKYVPA